MDISTQSLLFDNTGTVDEKLAQGKTDLKKALMTIPYLKEVVMGGEMAALAFDYMKENAPEGMKKGMGAALATAVKGRFSAFKNWLKQAWSGDTDILTIVGDYEDYLALFPTNSEKTPRVSLHQFFDATRAPGDRGNFSAYKEVIERMGMTAARDHYVGVRLESRNLELRNQYIDTVSKINILEGQIAEDLLAKKPLTSPFVSHSFICKLCYLIKFFVSIERDS